jgi:hypothetical protein
MSNLSPIRHYRLTDHAKMEMARRFITEDVVARILLNPEQMEDVRPGCVVYQSRLQLDRPPKMYLVRIFVDVDRNPPEVVTVYRTSKIEKYWRG